MVGRNAPCHCGARKANGEAVKYKSCHLQSDTTQAPVSRGGLQSEVQGSFVELAPLTDQTEVVMLVPSRGSLTAEFVQSVMRNLGGVSCAVLVACRMPVVEARNALWRQVVDLHKSSGRPFLVAWVDDDIWFYPETIPKLCRILAERPDIDVIAPISSDRMPFCAPAAYRESGNPNSLVMQYQVGDLVTVSHLAFPFVMHRSSLCERLTIHPFDIPPSSLWGEDFVFCDRVTEAGGKIALATDVVVAHVESEVGIAFVAGQRPGRIVWNTWMMADEYATASDQQIADAFAQRRKRRTYGKDVDDAHSRNKHAWHS